MAVNLLNRSLLIFLIIKIFYFAFSLYCRLEKSKLYVNKACFALLGVRGKFVRPIVLTLQASSLLAKHYSLKGDVRWTRPQDFRYTLTARLELWHEC